MPAVDRLYSGTTLTYSDEDGVLKADGASSTLVTFTLKDAEGLILEDAEDVVVSFTSTFGNFAEKRVTVQNGKATVMFTSESLTAIRNADLVGTVVEAKDANLIGLKAANTIQLDPNPEASQADTAGARVTEVEAAQADRIILYFNKEVSVDKYTKVNDSNKTRVIDPLKANVTVTDNVNNDLTGGSPVDVLGLLPVEGNTKALELILDVDQATPHSPSLNGTNTTNNELTDNSRILVEFNDLTGTVAVPSKESFNLTDSRKPEIVRVDREGLKTIKVTFSEAVTDKAEDGGNDTIRANDLNNWSIDGKKLNNNQWGAGTTTPKVTVGTFNPYTMEDTRNVVTIELGKKADGSQIYFESGTHSIQGANIGDWAAVTDQANNRMNTQTLDFFIPEDNEIPVAQVEVQSPEQWLVTFDKDVNQTAAQFAAALKFQGYNSTTKTWVDNYTGATSTPVNSISDNVSSINNDANLDLLVTKIDDNKFLVETDLDWSVVHNKETTGKNYFNYNYRLHIPADSVTNASNGKKNVEQDIALGGQMRSVDAQSPVIDQNIKQVDGKGSLAGVKVYEATMSEPVKLNNTANTEGATLAQDQTSLPVPTAEFVKKDGSKTIAGRIDTTFVDEYDKVLRAYAVNSAGTPIDLEAGEWTLIIRAISDDYGNTAASATKDFTVEGKEVDEQFRIAWAYADQDASTYTQVNGSVLDGNKDAVYVKFTRPVMTTGAFKSALTTSNYTLNGKALPDGTQILADIKGYDDHDTVIDSVTILLPDGTITDTETTVLNVTRFIESNEGINKEGKALENPGEKKLSYGFEVANSVSNEAQLRAAIANPRIRVINLNGNVTLTSPLTIDRIVELNLGANIITAGSHAFRIDTNEAGRTVIGGSGTIDALTVNTPNADFENNATITSLTTEALYGLTLINNGTITTLDMKTSTSVENKTGATIGTMTVDSGATITLDNSGTIATLINNGKTVVEKPGTITNPIAGTGTVEEGTNISTEDKKEVAVLAEVAKITPAKLGTITVGDAKTVLEKAQALVSDGYTVTVKDQDGAKINSHGVATEAGAGTISFIVTKDLVSRDTATLAIDVKAAIVNAEAPVIITDLNPTTSVEQNESLVLDATAEALSDAGTLSYKWFKAENANKLNPVQVATTAKYTVPTDTIGDSFYYAEITNTNNDATGTKTAKTTSTVAKVTVTEAALVDAETPVITDELADVTESKGTAVTLDATAKAVADGGTLTYKWFKANDADKTGKEVIPGQTDATYSVPVDVAGEFFYYAEITNTTADATGEKVVTIQSAVSTVTIQNVNAELTSVLGKSADDLTIGSEAGTVLEPKKVTLSVANGTNTLALSQILAADSGTVQLFTNSDFITDEITGEDTTEVADSTTTDVYIKVTSEDGKNYMFYKVTITTAN